MTMMPKFLSLSVQWTMQWTLGAALAAALSLAATPATAQGAAPGDDARAILKRMTDYIASQQLIAARYDSSIEAVTTQGQKISFNSTGRIVLQRPDKLRVSRLGGYSDVEMIFDGNTLSVFGRGRNAYTQISAPGTVENLFDKIRERSDLALPGADLFSANAYQEMTDGVTSARHIGRGVISGVECEHLAFRTPDVDWQVWVQVGPSPIPRRYVITSKNVAGSPQYAIQINDWSTSVTLAADTFTFIPAAGAQRVAAAELKQIDELPEGVTLAARN